MLEPKQREVSVHTGVLQMRGLGMLEGRRMRRQLQNVHGRQIYSAAKNARLDLCALSSGGDEGKGRSCGCLEGI